MIHPVRRPALFPREEDERGGKKRGEQDLEQESRHPQPPLEPQNRKVRNTRKRTQDIGHVVDELLRVRPQPMDELLGLVGDDPGESPMHDVVPVGLEVVSDDGSQL